MRPSRQLAIAAVLGAGTWAGTYELVQHEAPPFHDQGKAIACALNLGDTATQTSVLAPDCEEFKPAFPSVRTTTTTYKPFANALNPKGEATGTYTTGNVRVTYDLPANKPFLNSITSQDTKWSSTHGLTSGPYWEFGAAAAGLSLLLLNGRRLGGAVGRRKKEEEPSEGSPA